MTFKKGKILIVKRRKRANERITETDRRRERERERERDMHEILRNSEG